MAKLGSGRYFDRPVVGNLPDYFWSRANFAEPDEKGCWTFGPDKPNASHRTYPTIGGTDGPPVSAHRVSYLVNHGDIKPGEQILHTCDNKRCVNPDHLYKGDHQKNVADAVLRGRYKKGTSHWKASIDAALAGKIKWCLRNRKDLRQADIARTFGVSRSVVSAIKFDRTWQHAKEIIP